jgi:ketosteroid isomerase-like protein
MIGALMAKKAARDAFAAMNRHDLDAFMAAWGAQPVFEFPGESILGGRYEGRDQVRAWFQRWWDRFPSTTFELRSVSVDNIMAMGGTNTIHVEWDLTETDRKGRTVKVAGITALEARGGKVVHVRDYLFNPDVIAEAWADVDAAEPGEPLEA